LKIYLAGPLGFSEAGRLFGHTVLIPVLHRLGHEVLDPWQLIEERKIDAVRAMPYGLGRRAAWRKLNTEIAASNRGAIESCDLLLAILDGSDIDSGTASEIGYAFAKGKPILGYRSDYRLCADNEGATVNLQVEYFIRESGGDIIACVADLDGSLTKCSDSLRRNRMAT